MGQEIGERPRAKYPEEDIPRISVGNNPKSLDNIPCICVLLFGHLESGHGEKGDEECVCTNAPNSHGNRSNGDAKLDPLDLTG